jgi:hypothetical protein
MQHETDDYYLKMWETWSPIIEEKQLKRHTLQPIDINYDRANKPNSLKGVLDKTVIINQSRSLKREIAFL